MDLLAADVVVYHGRRRQGHRRDPRPVVEPTPSRGLGVGIFGKFALGWG